MGDFTRISQPGIEENTNIDIIPQEDNSDTPIVGKTKKLILYVVTSIRNIANVDNITNNSDVATVGGIKSSLYYKEKFKIEKLQGMSCPIDIYDCNLALIQSQEYIQQFIDELCRELGWEKIGTTYMKYFDNEDPGITFKQRTDQGIVSAHFKDLTEGVCIDIHSREYFDPNMVTEYSKSFFEGGKTILDVSYREGIKQEDNPSEITTTGGTQTVDFYRNKYESGNLWGMSSAIDIHECDIIKIAIQNNMTVEQYIKQFVADLCGAIEMVTDGETQVDHINHHGKNGTEFTQVITTSLISGHFRHDTDCAYFEIFSCKFYDPNFVALFVKNYFDGGSTKMHVSYRGIK